MENTYEKRQLGWKNYRLFIVLVVVVIGAGVLFTWFILNFGLTNDSYAVGAGSTVLDKDYKVLNVPVGGEIARKYNGNYELTIKTNDGAESKYELGKNTVSYSDSDYKFYLYGQSYLVNRDMSVKKSERYEEISKNTPSFYKLDDRKYLIADKVIRSKEISLNESGYLIVDIDRQGNATLVNNKINIKTINPIIIKGSFYDFDVAHEKLYVDEQEIDLTNVIGSSNEYVDPEIPEDLVPDTGEEVDPTDELITYYDNYFNRVKNSFNNLYSSTNKANNSIEAIAKKTNVALDLTRWTNVTKVTTTPSSITINYTVFDPNNDYSQIFVILSEYGSNSESRFALSKENSTYLIRDLKPDTKYSIRYGYTLAKIIDDSQAEVFADNLVVETKRPKTAVNITKITANSVNYVLKLDQEYAISQAKIRFIVDNAESDSIDFDLSRASNNEFAGSFAFYGGGRVVEVRVTDMSYNGVGINETVSDIYINE